MQWNDESVKQWLISRACRTKLSQQFKMHHFTKLNGKQLTQCKLAAELPSNQVEDLLKRKNARPNKRCDSSSTSQNDFIILNDNAACCITLCRSTIKKRKTFED